MLIGFVVILLLAFDLAVFQGERKSEMLFGSMIM